MTRLLLILLGWLLLPGVVFCQHTLRGKVIASDTRKPVALANVYLSNTSVGTVTAENGDFEISAFPEGRFDLVVSFIGYETYVMTLQSAKLPSLLEIVITPKVTELQEVIVEPYEKNGWEKWGKFFLDNFIGTSANARDCKLLNKEVIRFRHNKKQNSLRAFADETLIIENNALGYRLKYDLTRFEFDFNNTVFYYQGYPFFEDLQTKRGRRERKWQEQRAESYDGSLMHFMRSLYRNKLIEDHYEVRKLIKVSEEEKKRVRGIFQGLMRGVTVGAGRPIDMNTIMSGLPPDSVVYYKKVTQHPEQLNVLVKQVLPGDSIAFAVDSVTAGLHFTDYLQVVYPPKKMPAEYQQYLHTQANGPVVSELVLPMGKNINVLSNGFFYEGFDMLTLGYWAWSEKIANMLPYEYELPSNKP